MLCDTHNLTITFALLNWEFTGLWRLDIVMKNEVIRSDIFNVKFVLNKGDIFAPFINL